MGIIEEDGKPRITEQEAPEDPPVLTYTTHLLSAATFILSDTEKHKKLINVHGLPGVGKSIFLGDLGSIVGVRETEIIRATDFFTDGPFPIFKTEKFEAAVQKQADTQAAGHSSVVIIDDYDQIPQQPHERFRDMVLPGLLTDTKKNCIVVLASNRNADDRFDKSMVEDRIWHIELNGFSEHDLQTALPKTSRATIKNILDYTGGMPALVARITDRLNGQDFPDRESFETFLAEDYAFREELKNAILPGDFPYREKLPEILALLRKFDAWTLRHILPSIDPGTFARWGDEQTVRLRRELGSRAVYSDEYGYRLRPEIRRGMANFLKRFEPEFVQDVHIMMIGTLATSLSDHFSAANLLALAYHTYEKNKDNTENAIRMTRLVIAGVIEKAKQKTSAKEINAQIQALRHGEDRSVEDAHIWALLPDTE
jgi:hypothetical protein